MRMPRRFAYQGPPIYSFAMSFSLYYFGGEVLWRAAKGVSVAVANDALLAKTEVRQLHVTICIEEDIFRLQISIDNTVLVEAFECAQDLSCIEDRPRLCEPALLLEVIEELPSIEEVHDEVELRRCLESIV